MTEVEAEPSRPGMADHTGQEQGRRREVRSGYLVAYPSS